MDKIQFSDRNRKDGCLIMIITETKTQHKLVEESNKLRRAYKDMTEKERQAFYNLVKGQVRKQKKALEKIADGKVSKRYSVLAGENSPALEALETREGIIGQMPDKMPEDFEEFQKQMESAKKFLTAQTATAKNWMKLVKDETARTEKLLNRKFTVEESRKAWELIKKLESTDGGAIYDAGLSSEEGYRQIIAKVFDPSLSVDQMMTNWDNYRRGTTPQQIQDNDEEDMDPFVIARKQKQAKQTNNYFKQDKYVEDSNINTQVRKNKRR